jgi:hypothetical protein
MNPSLNLTRRHLLGQMTTGLTGVALSRLFTNELAAAPLHQPHFAPKAKQVLQIFCPGAASHMDLWDQKPCWISFMARRCQEQTRRSRFRARTAA